MAHVDDGTLNALLDGELGEREAFEVRAHVATCAECAARFEEAKRFLAEADDLLGALAPPAAATPVSRAPTASTAPGIPRRVSKTAREVAIDIDGATHKSPAIPPNFPRDGERAPEPVSPATGLPLLRERTLVAMPRRRPDWATLAWAASVVLALGVGYLANEVQHAKRPTLPSEDRLANATPAPSAAGARTGAARSTPPARLPQSRKVKESRQLAANLPAKPAAARGRKLARPSEEAAAQPLAGAGQGAPLVAQAPRPTSPAASGGAANALAARPAADAAAARGLDARSGEALAPSAGMPGAPNARGAHAPAPPAAVASRALPGPAFRTTDLDAAAARLSGTLRYIEGMGLVSVKIGSGALVPGADPSRDVVRVVYADPRGRRFQLDQQRIVLPHDTSRGALERAAPASLGLAWGDTLATAVPGGEARLRWLDRAGLWVSMSGMMPLDSLRTVLARVR